MNNHMIYVYLFTTIVPQHFDAHQAYTEHVKQQGDGDHGFLKLFQRKYTSSLTVSTLKTMLLFVYLDLTTHLVYTDWSCSYSFASTWRS